jgi:PII-like signaling protein
MSQPAIKLTTYFGERERVGERFLADALFDIYERHRMRTSVLLRGVEGFGERHLMQTDRLLTLSENLPAVSIAIDTRARIDAALADVLAISAGGLTSLERAQLITGDELDRPTLPGGFDGPLKLTVYGGRSVRAGSRPGYVAALEQLRAAGVAAASVLLGVDGTLHGERRRARFFARNAGVPLMLLALGDGTALMDALPRVAALLDEPVATLERVQICKSQGRALSEPHSVEEYDASGLPIWQKVMVHAEEQARCDGHPLYVELPRRLQEAGAAGATVLRGVRGFYGDHEPFADRLLSLRRNVPVHIVVVDAPSAVRRWWPVVDDATRDVGVVTAELVPATHGPGAPVGVRGLARTPTAG